MKFIKMNDRIYQFNFGLKDLIALEEFSNIYDEEEMKIIKFYLALNDNNLTFQEVKQIISQLKFDVDKFLTEVLEDSIGGVAPTAAPSIPSIVDQCEELYQLAVGQMGLPPQDVWKMTPKEIELAYKGYLQNKELDIKVNILSKYNKNVSILGEGCSISTISKREETFKDLKI